MDSNQDSRQGWRVLWDVAEDTTWDGLHGLATGSLQQSWRYGQAMRALGVPCMRGVVYEDGHLIGAAQFLGQRLPWFVRSALCSRGPLWHPGSTSAQRVRAVELLRQTLPLRRPRVAIFTPEVELGDATQEDYPCAGLRRVMTGYTTVLVDLRHGAAELRRRLDGNWRNRLVAAERHAPEVRDESEDDAAHEAIVETEWLQRGRRGYFSLPRQFVDEWRAASPAPATLGGTVLLSAWSSGARVAAALFLVHGRTATYHLGWAAAAGRQMHAHNLLLWTAFRLLQARGVELLDLGGVETVRQPGIARFKIGTGGRVSTLVGSYA